MKGFDMKSSEQKKSTSSCSFLRLVFIIAIGISITGCSKYEMYDWAVQSQRNAADLTVDSQEISDGEIVYLKNDTDHSKGTIVLIHGFGAEKQTWATMAKELSENYHLLIPDLPGHGESFQLPDLEYTIEKQVLRLSELLTVLNTGRVHLIGNSMGGAIAAKFSHRYPEKVKSLVLMNSAGIYQHKSELAYLIEKGENPLIVETPEDFQRLWDFTMSQPPYLPGPILKVLAEKKAAREKMDKIIFSHIRKDTMIEALLPQIKTPTLVLWGMEDRVINYKNADIFVEKMPNAQKVIYEDIGHAPMLEDPGRSAETIQKFLSSHQRN